MEKPDTTYPKLLVEKARMYQNRVAMREKYKGIWQEISWNMYLEKVKHFSLGLADLGMQAGPMISPELFWEFIQPSYARLIKPARILRGYRHRWMLPEAR